MNPRARGRPLKSRSNDDRIAFLERILGFGRQRRDVELHWEGAELRISVGPMGEARSERAGGADLGRVLDLAISRDRRAGGEP